MSEPIGNDEILPDGNDSEEENEEDEPKDETILFSPGKITIGDKEFGPVKDSNGLTYGAGSESVTETFQVELDLSFAE